MKKENIFNQLFIESKLYDDICSENNISRNELTNYYNYFVDQRGLEVQEIKRIRQLYNNKKGLSEFKFKSFSEFYSWYINQHKIQGGKCYYCECEELKIASLFQNNILVSKRSKYRGNHLEVERKDPHNEEYSKENCVLACYFCNNDKSDVFTESDYREYLKGRKKFIERKYKDITKPMLST